jgi:hypothetical protein
MKNILRQKSRTTKSNIYYGGQVAYKKVHEDNALFYDDFMGNMHFDFEKYFELRDKARKKLEDKEKMARRLGRIRRRFSAMRKLVIGFLDLWKAYLVREI